MLFEKLTIAIVGATGAVGRVLLSLLEERDYPALHILPLASARSSGKELPYLDESLTVMELDSMLLDGADVVFISATNEISKNLAKEAIKNGCLVIDDSSVYRMDESVPLVVPEVNPSDVDWHSGIISIPNCTTTPLVMALQALREVGPLKRVSVATYQAVSGAGARASGELNQQTRQVLDGEFLNGVVGHSFPKPIAFNLIPQVDSFSDNGYTKEELKIVNETRKILHMPNLKIVATCVRVPVFVSHSEVVQVEFARKFAIEEAIEYLSTFPNMMVYDDMEAYPTPLDATGKKETFIGRIRRDFSVEHGIVFWMTTDNLLKGAALNALQILDCVLERKIPLTR